MSVFHASITYLTLLSVAIAVDVFLPVLSGGRVNPTALHTALELYLAHLTVERGLSANTLLAYRRDLTRYTAFLESRGCADTGRCRGAGRRGLRASRCARDPTVARRCPPRRPPGPSWRCAGGTSSCSWTV